jgi:hypothetical protein
MPDDDLNLQTPPEVEDDEGGDQDEGQEPTPAQEESGESEDRETSEQKPEGEDTEPKQVSFEDYQKLMGQLKWTERQLKKQQEPSAAEPTGTDFGTPKPKVADFEVYDDYIESLAEWKIEQAKAKDLQSQRKEVQSERQRKVDGLVAKELAKDPDFLKKAYIPEAISDLIIDSDHVIELAKRFGQDPNKAFDLCRMSKVQAAREIGKIEQQIEAQKQGPKPKIQSRAPNSTKNVIGGNEPSGKRPEQMTTEEYIAWRNKQEFGE